MGRIRKNIDINKCGVYVIENIENKNIYIGSSVNCSNRFKTHIRDLRNGCHTNIHLQYSFNYYGEDKFKFKVLFNCKKDEQFVFEFEEIQKVINKGNGSVLYNIVKNPEMIYQSWYIRKMKSEGYSLCNNCLEFFIPISRNDEHVKFYEDNAKNYIENSFKHTEICDECLSYEICSIENAISDEELDISEQEFVLHCEEEGLGEYTRGVLPRCIINDMIKSGSWED